MKSAKDASSLIVALTKLFSLDVALVSSSYSQASNILIEQQSRALMELSTPTIQLWEGILVLPILGVLDSKRTQDMTNMMLAKIQQTNARWIIIDITDKMKLQVKCTFSTNVLCKHPSLPFIAP